MPDILLTVTPELKAAIKAAADAEELSMRAVLRRVLKAAFLPATRRVAPATRRVAASPVDDGFARWWAVYPRRTAKGAAEKAWRSLAPDPRLVDTIIAATEAQVAAGVWREARYTPHPATWLNQRRWEDEPPERKATNMDMSGIAAFARGGS